MGTEWRRPHIRYLRANWQRMTDAEIAERLGRTEMAVARRRHKLGLIRPKNAKPAWTASAKARAGKRKDAVISRSQGRVIIAYWEAGRKVKMDYPRYLWTKLHGEIPAGMAVKCRLDDPLLAGPDDLYLVDRSELARKALAYGREKYRSAGRHWRKDRQTGIFNAHEQDWL